jgi:hypothetical protein
VVFIEFGLDFLGLAIMLVTWAAAAGLVAYGINTGKTRYLKADNSFVENYKERVMEDDRIKRMKVSVSSVLWSVLLVMYFALSFLTNLWSVTWILFLVGVFVQLLVLYLLSKPRNGKFIYYGMIWSITLVVYFMISFAFDIWSWSWIIIFVALAVQEILRLLSILRKTSAS